MLFDTAMANCLFARSIVAVTARLIVRFLLPVAVEKPATVRAWVRELEPPLYVLEAELQQDGRILARASAKFIDYNLVMKTDKTEI